MINPAPYWLSLHRSLDPWIWKSSLMDIFLSCCSHCPSSHLYPSSKPLTPAALPSPSSTDLWSTLLPSVVVGHLRHLILGTLSTPGPTSWLFFFFLVTLTALLSNQLWSRVSNFSSVEIALHLKSWAPRVLCLFQIWAVLTTLPLYSLNLHWDLPRVSFRDLLFLNVPGVEDPAGSGS